MLAKITEYAIRALVYIQLQNWNEHKPGVIEIAEKIEAPKAYSGKILEKLAKNKFIASIRGRGGGFFFEDYHIKLSVYSVILHLEGDACFINWPVQRRSNH